MNIADIWQQIYDMLLQQTPGSNVVGFNVHMKGAVPVSMDENKFTVSVPMEINKNMIAFRYKESIEAALERITGIKLELVILLDSELEIENQQTQNSGITFTPQSFIEEAQRYNSINPKFTFENFVVGSSNEYAYNAAYTCARNPGYYNPLFIYGNSGLGKTHLMHAIGNRTLDLNNGAKVMYVTSEDFTNEFIKSIGDKTTDKFRKKYREVDVLLVDDIQFIETKDATQEEFFHTFNSLTNLNKQIVLTSDRKPTELLTLEERLRTRFSGGYTIDISLPNFETRVAILQKKAAQHNVKIDDSVLNYIAKKIKSNVRELEGILIKMISIAQISNIEYDISLADDVIRAFLPHGGNIKITPELIIKKVSTFYNLTKNEIIGQSRVKNISFPRQIAMYLCAELADMNFSMIGKSFGNKDRTTVMHNVRKIKSILDSNSDDKLNNDIRKIIKDLKNDNA